MGDGVFNVWHPVQAVWGAREGYMLVLHQPYSGGVRTRVHQVLGAIQIYDDETRAAEIAEEMNDDEA